MVTHQIRTRAGDGALTLLPKDLMVSFIFAQACSEVLAELCHLRTLLLKHGLSLKDIACLGLLLSVACKGCPASHCHCLPGKLSRFC